MATASSARGSGCSISVYSIGPRGRFCSTKIKGDQANLWCHKRDLSPLFASSSFFRSLGEELYITFTPRDKRGSHGSYSIRLLPPEAGFQKTMQKVRIFLFGPDQPRVEVHQLNPEQRERSKSQVGSLKSELKKLSLESFFRGLDGYVEEGQQESLFMAIKEERDLVNGILHTLVEEKGTLLSCQRGGEGKYCTHRASLGICDEAKNIFLGTYQLV